MSNATFSDDISFFGRLARLRLASAKFLTHGRLWRPPVLEAAPPTAVLTAAQVCDFGSLGHAAITGGPHSHGHQAFLPPTLPHPSRSRGCLPGPSS